MLSTLSYLGGLLLLSIPPLAEPASSSGLDAFQEPAAPAKDEGGMDAAELARLLDQHIQSVEAVAPGDV